MKKWLWGDKLSVWLWFFGTALPLIAIYLYTKFYSNANSSFSYLPDKVPRRLYVSPFWEHNKYMYIDNWSIASINIFL